MKRAGFGDLLLQPGMTLVDQHGTSISNKRYHPGGTSEWGLRQEGLVLLVVGGGAAVSVVCVLYVQCDSGDRFSFHGIGIWPRHTDDLKNVYLVQHLALLK